MNFTQLESFFIVVEEGSMAAAASRLFVTPSALTQQIKALENEIGFSLFIRKHNGVQLTEAGRSFYQESFQSVSRIQSAVLSGKAIANNLNVLKLYIQDSCYAPALDEFCLANPDIMIQHIDLPDEDLEYIFTALENRYVDLVDGEYTYAGESRGFGFFKTHETELCAAISFRNPFRNKDSFTLEELSREHAILYLSLWHALELLSDKDTAGLTRVSTLYSASDAWNRMEAGSIFIFEKSFVGKLAPFCHVVPIIPKITIPYGFIYRKDSLMAQKFLEYVKVIAGPKRE